MKENKMSSSVASHCSISLAEFEPNRSTGGGGMIHLSPEPSTQDPNSLPSPDLNRRNQVTTTCCFRWCSSCSRLPTKRSVNFPSKSIQPTAQQAKKQSPNMPNTTLPLEELEQWHVSFERILRSHNGRQVFREFLKSEYSEENMLFWLAIEEYRQIEDSRIREERARIIYEDYISILSPKEVSLDSRVREVINSQMPNPSRVIFDEAQMQIFTLMQRDSFPRFLNSQLYKSMLAAAVPSALTQPIAATISSATSPTTPTSMVVVVPKSATASRNNNSQQQ